MCEGGGGGRAACVRLGSHPINPPSHPLVSFVFQISISLTEEGERHLSQVLDLTFASVALNRRVPPSDDAVRVIYEDLVQLATLR